MAEFLTLVIDGIDLKEGFVRIFEIRGTLINDAKFGRKYKLIERQTIGINFFTRELFPRVEHMKILMENILSKKKFN